VTSARINGLRSIELGVPDLAKSADFYRNVWALADASTEGEAIHLRGTGHDHHVVTLREGPKAALLGVHFSAPDRASVDALYAHAKGLGARIDGAPAVLAGSAGGGYGFRLHTPEGHPLSISSDVERHAEALDDRSRPTKLSHVVLNSADVPAQTEFFLDVLGFRLSDSTAMMDFERCCSDHHSVAFARGNGPSLNHMAYEMPNVDGLMRGAGRLRKNGFPIEWGVGRHGPGNNVFSYFVEPNGFVAEYTAEVEQVDDNYVFHDAQWWKDQNLFPCRWGMAGLPSEIAHHAMSGQAVEDFNARCEDVIARKLGR
jgi:catechol 2,3-dioxygenase-like lactoylglutathione lyase family enzyme